MHPDSLLHYAGMAYDNAVKTKDKAEQVRSKYYQSVAITTKGLVDSSLRIAAECIEALTTEVRDLAMLARVYNQMGRCYIRQNSYNDAIEMGYKTIEMAEKAQHIFLQVKGKTLIGWAYMEMGQNDLSLAWHLKALKTTPDTAVLNRYEHLYANLALNYAISNNRDSAFYYIEMAIQQARIHEHLFALANSLAIRSQLYIDGGEARKAELSLQEAIDIRKTIGDPFFIVSDLSQLGLFYAHNKMPDKGIAICLEGISIAKRYALDTKLLFLYTSLGENYKAAGNDSMYARTLEQIVALKDTVFKKNSAEELAQVQTRYEMEKKENLIIRQQLEITRQSYFFYALLALAFFAVLIAWRLFREYKRKQKIKISRMQEDVKNRSLVAVQKAGENERRRIAADLHDNLGAYAASIAANADQLSLNNNDHANQLLLKELKGSSQAIVSQLIDTIWALKRDNLSLTAISDRIKVFIQRMRPSYPGISLEVIENIRQDVQMAAPHAFNLYQIAQEGLFNAVKHSDAKAIIVFIDSDAGWQIRIVDDGKGITKQDEFLGSGNGLFNMENRARECGWKIQWLKNEPTGTIVAVGVL